MGMDAGKFKGKGGVQPEMNITPLVDVVLVLLIIFMIVTPQMENVAPVELPKIYNPDPVRNRKTDTLEISIVRNGDYYIEKEKMGSLSGLESELQQLHRKNPHKKVLIRGDREIKFLSVREVFAAVRKVGFKGASLLVTVPRPERRESGL